MEWYDLIMIVVLAGTTLFGFAKGMAWQIASVASLVVSYLLALRFSEPLAATGYLGDEAPWNRFVAMLVIYVATSLAIWLMFRVVSGAIDRVRLQEFDRQIGGLVGFAKGVLYCVAITFFAVTLVPAARDAILRSRSGHFIALLIARADAVMPPEVHEILDPYLDRLEEELGEGQGNVSQTQAGAAREAPKIRPAAVVDGAATGPLLRDAKAGVVAGEATADDSRKALRIGDIPVGAQLRQPWERSASRVRAWRK